MESKVLKHIKASDLSAEFLEEIGIYPDQYITITIEIEDEAANMPSEDKFRLEFIREMQRRDQEYDRSKSTICETDEEIDAFFEQLLNEEDD
ncbi:hypothetical protein MCHI_004015 [Candidatus Magnetoovum chiemensis]|nr:hypothetical protein MCHI_004015 [Candidatus Magnetoovum chiemensis]